MEQIPVLLDTDPGNDIDDVLAIAYLAKEPRCQFLGITTVTGDVAKRAALAEVVCRAAGREDVPIYAGRREVLVYGPGQPNVPQYEAIREIPHRTDYPENQAVEFLRSQIRQRPGEIVLLTIGPFSNVGLLFALDPEIPFLLRSLVSMGGAFFGHNNWEWNCKVDPVATAMTVAASRPNHTWFGLDVTTQVRQPAETVRRLYKSPNPKTPIQNPKSNGEPLSTILPMAEIYFRNASHIVYHDPLAAVCVFEPDICEYKTGRVSIDPADGHSHFEEGEGPDHIAVSVEPERFFEQFFGVTGHI